jgi:hypothetical protein
MGIYTELAENTIQKRLRVGTVFAGDRRVYTWRMGLCKTGACHIIYGISEVMHIRRPQSL